MGSKVLLADGSMTIQKLVELTLTKEGYEVSIAEDGNSALQTAKSLSPQIFLIESQLKGVDGYEVSRILREVYGFKDALILVLLGPAESFDELRGELVSGFLKKPFESIEVLGKINEYLSGYRTRGNKVLNRSLSEGFELKEITEMLQDDPGSESSALKEEPAEKYLEPTEEGIEPVGKEEENWILSSRSSLFRGKEEETIGKIFDDIAPDPKEGEVKYMDDEPPAYVPPPARRQAESREGEREKQKAGNMQEEIAQKIGNLSRECLEEIIARVAKETVEKVAWEVVPSLAEIAIRKEIERLKTEEPE